MPNGLTQFLKLCKNVYHNEKGAGMGAVNTVLSDEFKRRASQTELTDAGIAKAIGVSRQFYSDIKQGKKQVTTRFLIGAIEAGLADTANDVISIERTPGEEQAAS